MQAVMMKKTEELCTGGGVNTWLTPPPSQPLLVVEKNEKKTFGS